MLIIRNLNLVSVQSWTYLMNDTTELLPLLGASSEEDKGLFKGQDTEM